MNSIELNLDVNHPQFLQNLIKFISIISIEMEDNEDPIDHNLINILTDLSVTMRDKIKEIIISNPPRIKIEEWVDYFAGLLMTIHDVREAYPIYNQ